MEKKGYFVGSESVGVPQKEEKNKRDTSGDGIDPGILWPAGESEKKDSA